MLMRTGESNYFIYYNKLGSFAKLATSYPHAEGIGHRILRSKESSAAGHPNPDKRLAISWHHPGIFLKCPLCYTGVLFIRPCSGGEARCGRAREHGRLCLRSSPLLRGLLEVSAPWHKM